MSDLLLRRWAATDVEFAREASQDPYIASMMEMRPLMGERAAANWISRCTGLVIEWNGRPVGEVGLQPESDGRTAALWYWILPRYRGQGLAYRAARLACHRAREIALRAFVSERNQASVHILRKLGFAKGGPSTQYAGYPGPRDTYLYSRQPVLGTIKAAPDLSGQPELEELS